MSEVNKPVEGAAAEDAPASRMQLLWDVLVFQFKLAMDGLRDVLLVPVSIVAAIIGFVVPGDPARFFLKVLAFGRRTEAWINLFGHDRDTLTADDMIEPIQRRVFDHAENNPTLKRAGEKINRSLDSVSQAMQKPSAPRDTPPED